MVLLHFYVQLIVIGALGTFSDCCTSHFMTPIGVLVTIAGGIDHHPTFTLCLFLWEGWEGRVG